MDWDAQTDAMRLDVEQTVLVSEMLPQALGEAVVLKHSEEEAQEELEAVDGKEKVPLPESNGVTDTVLEREREALPLIVNEPVRKEEKDPLSESVRAEPVGRALGLREEVVQTVAETVTVNEAVGERVGLPAALVLALPVAETEGLGWIVLVGVGESVVQIEKVGEEVALEHPETEALGRPEEEKAPVLLVVALAVGEVKALRVAALEPLFDPVAELEELFEGSSLAVTEALEVRVDVALSEGEPLKEIALPLELGLENGESVPDRELD